MFSFALYDKTEHKVFLVRDRMGIKPLYYGKTNDEIIFGSEIKAILASKKIDTNYSLNAISNYLSFRYPIGSQSLFENIFTLEPAHYLEINLSTKKIKKIRYWDIPITSTKEDLGEEYYKNKLYEILYDAVKYRMISDVEFGAYLSGGIDSSIITALMSKIHKQKIKTFTIGFEEKEYNEFRYSKMVAEMYHTEHHAIFLNPSKYFETNERLISYKDAPLSVPNEPALYQMSKALKKHFTVVLSGEGADELFGGYGRIFKSPYDYNRYKFIKTQNLSTRVSNLFIKNFNDKYGNHHDSVNTFFLFLYKYINLEEKKSFMSRDFLNATENDESIDAFFQKHFTETQSLSITEQYMHIFEKIHIQGLLNRLDTTTMAASVEGRVPFVDHNLIEFAFSIPVKYKIKWKSEYHKAFSSHLTSDKISETYDIPKYLLKKTFENMLPNEIVQRKKMGFPVPLHKWLGASFNSYAKEILLDRSATNRKLFNQINLEKILNNNKNYETHSFGIKIWMLINLELWIRNYFDK